MNLFTLITLLLDALFSRRLTPTEKTPSAHPTGPLEGTPQVDAPIPTALPSGDIIAPPLPPAPIVTDESVPLSLVPILAAMRRLGYRVFDKDDRPFNLNIVGVRNPRAALDKFDCRLHVFWKHQGKWTHYDWAITTFPGSRYLLEKLLNPKGAAILVPGQYLGVYRLDIHNGKYRALCQRNGPVNVFRDGDKDRAFDLDPRTVQSGSFGMNIHAHTTPTSGNKQSFTDRVYAASAGCQVFQRMADFLEFYGYCEACAKIYGNQFSYTLITLDDLSPATAAPVPARPIAAEGTVWQPDLDTAGVRNKNILNIKGEGWLYSTGRDSRGHNIFPSHAKGLRAGILNLRAYWTRHNKRSIAAILSRWAPASDTIGSLPGAPPNSPLAYSRFVEARVGIGATAPLSIFDNTGAIRDTEQLYRLVAAMAAYENDASLVLPRAIFDEALSLV
jgi:hypothetical protein